MAIGSITGSSGSSDPTSPVRTRCCWRRRSARSSPRGAGAPTSSIASASEVDGKTVPTSSQLWTALLDWRSQTRRRLSAHYDLVSSRYRLSAFITGASLKLNKKAGRSPLLTCSQKVQVGTVNTSLSSQTNRWSPTIEKPAPSTT